MKRRIAIEVKNNKEAKAIETALQDNGFKVMALIVGTLQPFKPRAQQRIMQFVMDKIADEETVP